MPFVCFLLSHANIVIETALPQQSVLDFWVVRQTEYMRLIFIFQ